MILLRKTLDTFTPDLARIIVELRRSRFLLEAGAKSVQKEISDHLKRLQARGNVKGWPPQHFFAGRPASVERHVGIPVLTDTQAEVVIADPRFVHRIEGGTVVPKRKKYLAIPLTAEAYAAAGKGSIRESMPGLKVIKFPSGLFLVRELEERTTQGATGRRKYGPVKRIRLIALFKLLRSVTHNPHPEELPDAAALGRVAETAMDKAARRLLRIG
jgi:hypothetical protein